MISGLPHPPQYFIPHRQHLLTGLMGLEKALLTTPLELHSTCPDTAR